MAGRPRLPETTAATRPGPPAAAMATQGCGAAKDPQHLRAGRGTRAATACRTRAGGEGAPAPDGRSGHGGPGSGEEEAGSGPSRRRLRGTARSWGGRRNGAGEERRRRRCRRSRLRLGQGGYCSDLLELILITMVTINVNCPRLVKVSIVI